MNLVSTLAQNISTLVTNYKIRNARRKAVRSALMSLASVYPEYVGIGFDEEFMTKRASDLMQPFIAGGSLPTADALLTAWASQFPFANESAKRAIANITPMVTEFLYVLGQDLSVTEAAATNPAVTAETSRSISESPSTIAINPGYAAVS